jgi:hypothetical protein
MFVINNNNDGTLSFRWLLNLWKCEDEHCEDGGHQISNPITFASFL